MKNDASTFLQSAGFSVNNGNDLVNLDGRHKCLRVAGSHSFRAVKFSVEALTVSRNPLILPPSEQRRAK